MKLTIVIVNYNVKHYLLQCLLSLQKALANIDSEAYVVDNHSSDGSIDYLEPLFKECQRPQFFFIRSHRNLGFARGNNLAIRQAKGQYVLLLNPDTFVGEETIARALDFMDAHPQAGGLGCCMLQGDGNFAKESRRGLPTPMTSFYKITGLCSKFPNSRRFARYHMSYLPWNEPSRIEVVSGAFFLLRKAVIDEVGALDEDFFMYGEDIDLSYRVLKGGYDNWYLPVKILHYKGESTQKSSFHYIHVFYEAMLIFFRKHYGHMSLLFSIPIKLAIYFQAFVAFIKIQFGRVRKGLGFVQRKYTVEPVYTFLTTADHIEQCRQFALAHGLDARFHIADAATNPQGHHDPSLNLQPLPANRYGYMVYDVTAYAYQDILNIFASKPIDDILIGTYYPDRQILITGGDIIK